MLMQKLQIPINIRSILDAWRFPHYTYFLDALLFPHYFYGVLCFAVKCPAAGNGYGQRGWVSGFK